MEVQYSGIWPESEKYILGGHHVKDTFFLKAYTSGQNIRVTNFD